MSYKLLKDDKKCNVNSMINGGRRILYWIKKKMLKTMMIQKILV